MTTLPHDDRLALEGTQERIEEMRYGVALQAPPLTIRRVASAKDDPPPREVCRAASGSAHSVLSARAGGAAIGMRELRSLRTAAKP